MKKYGGSRKRQMIRPLLEKGTNGMVGNVSSVMNHGCRVMARFANSINRST